MRSEPDRARTRALLWALLVPLLAAAPAGADGHVSAQVGPFIPWDGDVGVATTVQLMGSNASGRSRWGGEFEYRNFDSRISGVDDVEVDSYLLRALWQYHFRPDSVVTPYIGLGLGIVIDVVDDDKVDAAKGENARSPAGAGLDGLFLLGVAGNMPGAEYLSLFAEGRLGIGFDVAGRGDRDGVTTENVGGAAVHFGLRFRF